VSLWGEEVRIAAPSHFDEREVDDSRHDVDLQQPDPKNNKPQQKICHSPGGQGNHQTRGQHLLVQNWRYRQHLGRRVKKQKSTDSSRSIPDPCRSQSKARRAALDSQKYCRWAAEVNKNMDGLTSGTDTPEVHGVWPEVRGKQKKNRIDREQRRTEWKIHPKGNSSAGTAGRTALVEPQPIQRVCQGYSQLQLSHQSHRHSGLDRQTRNRPLRPPPQQKLTRKHADLSTGPHLHQLLDQKQHHHPASLQNGLPHL